jgi:hypothetical protein
VSGSDQVAPAAIWAANALENRTYIRNIANGANDARTETEPSEGSHNHSGIVAKAFSYPYEGPIDTPLSSR